MSRFRVQTALLSNNLLLFFIFWSVCGLMGFFKILFFFSTKNPIFWNGANCTQIRQYVKFFRDFWNLNQLIGPLWTLFSFAKKNPTFRQVLRCKLKSDTRICLICRNVWIPNQIICFFGLLLFLLSKTPDILTIVVWW